MLNYRKAYTIKISVANGQTTGQATIAVPDTGRVWLDSIVPTWVVFATVTPGTGEYKFTQSATVKARIHERQGNGVTRTIIGQSLDCKDGAITVDVTLGAAVVAAQDFWLTYFVID